VTYKSTGHIGLCW